MVTAVMSFQGPYRFLSNFWPCIISFEGLTFPSVEAAYQASKTLDLLLRTSFTHMAPGQAKRAGKKFFLRPDWSSVRLSLMEQFIHQKFTQNAELRTQLLATGTSPLVEGNAWGDVFWGVSCGRGENHLGKILMKVRAELQPPSIA